jgi:beta-N-acetylglucosaminidase
MSKEFQKNPIDFYEFMKEYLIYRETHPFINVSPEVLKEFFIEQWSKEDKIWFDAQKTKIEINPFDTFFKKKENSNFNFLTIDSVSKKDLSDLNNLDLNLNSLNHNKN